MLLTSHRPQMCVKHTNMVLCCDLKQSQLLCQQQQLKPDISMQNFLHLQSQTVLLPTRWWRNHAWHPPSTALAVPSWNDQAKDRASGKRSSFIRQSSRCSRKGERSSRRQVLRGHSVTQLYHPGYRRDHVCAVNTSADVPPSRSSESWCEQTAKVEGNTTSWAWHLQLQRNIERLCREKKEIFQVYASTLVPRYTICPA